MMRVALIACLIVCSIPALAAADEPFVCPNPDVRLGLVGCEVTADQLNVLVQQAASSLIRYRVDPMCVEMQQQPICINPVRCDEPPSSYRYHVFRSDDAGATWTEIASVCLGEVDTDSLRVITELRIIREFRRLDWPTADLVIQPPDGRTLVNLKTNFYTNTTEPQVQPVTIFGHTIEIEATPSSYTWHFGDGTSESGDQPGAPYPALDVTHVYLKAGVRVGPSVDVTYSGRWRIDGGGWQDIPQTLTVEGTPVELEVLSATPYLVG